MRRMIHSKSVPRFQSPTIPITRSHSESEWKDTWKSAVLKAKERKDPWERYNIPDSCGVEKAYRYRYSALEKKWVRDEIEVKMQNEVTFLDFRFKVHFSFSIVFLVVFLLGILMQHSKAFECIPNHSLIANYHCMVPQRCTCFNPFISATRITDSV